MAAFRALWKRAARTGPPAAAFATAELWTFSKTRGTPRIRLGRARWNSTPRVEKFDQWDWVPPPMATARDTARDSTWANGRNVSTREPGRAMAPMGLVSRPCTSESQLAWVSRQPFGRPVVPEVYTSDARSRDLVAWIRSSTWSSSMGRPSNLRVAMAEALISRMRRSCDVEPCSRGLPSSPNTRFFMSSVCSRVSVTANTAPESSIIHSIWLREEEP